MQTSFEIKDATVLVADDNPTNLKVVETMLRTFGCNVRVALDGSAAVKSALARSPDLILLDINMPKMDGYSACEELKRLDATRGVPVIFASAMDEEVNKVKGFEVGAVDYITKPLQLEELRARISTHLQISRQRKTLSEQAEDLRTLNKSMVGRELRILELKNEVNNLSRSLSVEPPYPEADE